MEDNITLLKILEENSIDSGEMGLLVGERGSGKTACLISIGIERIFKGDMILHVSLEELPERIATYYELKINEAAKFIKSKNRIRNIDAQRIILSYLNNSFDINRLNSNIINLKKNMSSNFDLMLIDGLEADDMSVFQGIKRISKEHNLKTWISYPLRSYLRNENKLKDICDVVLQLYSDHYSAYVLLIKGRKKDKEGLRLELDPVTFFIK